MTYNRIGRLRSLHRQIEQLLREELRRPDPDAYALQDLKRRKLQVKDELFLAESGLAPVTIRSSHG